MRDSPVSETATWSGGMLVLESDKLAGPFTTDTVRGFCRVDDYPIGRGDIHVGDELEAVQEKSREAWVTTRVRLLRPALPPAPARASRAPQSPLRAREPLTHRVTQAMKG